MSHENTEVNELYDTFLEHPLSEQSEKLLHTVYSPRGSGREKLGRFLDAVDHRDGACAGMLFASDGVWHTNMPGYDDIKGPGEIENFINKTLPPIESFAKKARHRLKNPTEGTEVIMPNGQVVNFDVILDENNAKIKSLTRNLI